MARNLASILFLVILAGTVFAQSGRNKSKQEPEQPNRPKPSIELPSSRILVKATPAPAPTPPKTDSDEDGGEVLKVDSVLVPIPVSVTDAKGNAVTNLVREDFELRVNGEVQEVSDVFRSDTPVRIALMFDNSSSVNIARDFETKAAVKFIKRILRPQTDRAALFSISDIVKLEVRLTNDTSSLIRAITTFPPPRGGTKLLDGVIDASNYLKEFSNDGRRVIVIVSDGIDTLSDITLERDGLEQVVRAAQIANCQIYVVKTTDFENFQRTGVRGSNANLRDLTAERRMQELAAQTGGAVYSPLDEKELETAFTRIAAELSQQYILSYYPNDDKRDGSFKQISLQIKSQKNLTVRTRKGYYVPKS